MERSQNPRPLKLRLVILLTVLLLPAIACGLTNPIYALNNQVRLTVYEYEREQRGLTDDLVLHYQRDEPRLRFPGQNEAGGRTVWLDRFGAAEFFALRPEEETYLYIQNIEYGQEYQTATATVYRGDGTSYQGRELTLKRNGEQSWVVTAEIKIEE